MVSDRNIQHNRHLSHWLIELLILWTKVILLSRYFIILKKAFDMVDHPTLLKKLYVYGIRGNASNWLKSYLSERSQYVVYDSKWSEMQTVKCGVPQGSILGHLCVRQKHSTQQALITLVDRITNSLDKGDIVISIFHNLKKAFDMVDHPTLLKKLYVYGIRGNASNWLKSYLSERSQYVVYDSKWSEMQTVKCGVPQGSILGHLLFMIYMNDICNASELLFLILYANDTSVQISGKDITYLVRSLNVKLELLHVVEPPRGGSNDSRLPVVEPPRGVPTTPACTW